MKIFISIISTPIVSLYQVNSTFSLHPCPTLLTLSKHYSLKVSFTSLLCWAPFPGSSFSSVYSLFGTDLFIYFWLSWAFTTVQAFSLAAASGGCPPGVVCGLLIFGGFLSRSSDTQASAAVTQLSLSTTQVSYPDVRSDLCPLHWQGDS